MLLKEERDFYGNQRWVLLPFLSFEQVMERLNLLLNQEINSLPEWCRQEWNINLYLLSAAVADMTDDYLVRGVWNFSKLADYLSLMAKPVDWIRRITLLKSRVMGDLGDEKVREFRRSWANWLISVCLSLVRGQIPGSDEQRQFKNKFIPLLQYRFPRPILTMRMRIPAAFRSQDLTHHDFVTLGRKYVERRGKSEFPQIVIGLRTAGTYIAPVVCSFLRNEGYKEVSYMTIRPKNFIHPWDAKQILENLEKNVRYVLVDEPPSSGKTIVRCVEILKKFGVKSEAITIMVPCHPAQRDWLDPTTGHSLEGSEIIMLEPEEWYKPRLLEAAEFRKSIKPYFDDLGFDDVDVVETESTRKINEQLIQNPDKAYHVRLKKVFHVIPQNGSQPRNGLIVMAKSVGWGWLGYHAALSAQGLSEFVPKVFGVRQGMMYSEWVRNGHDWSKELKDEGDIVKKVSGYICRRTNLLRLNENPSTFLSKYRESGMQSVAIILSNVFGPKVSKLKRDWVRNQLEKFECPVPVLTDSRMAKNEWVDAEMGLLKTDFEHHGFSKTASHNIADPAYDIAAAMLEFELSDEGKKNLIHTYIRETGDTSVGARLLFYELLCGTEAITDSLKKLNMPEYYPNYKMLNAQYVGAWNYMVSETSRRAGGFCKGEPVRHWNEPMFVMDIDDVFDKNILGFPSTTANGIRSLSLLRAHGVCSVINTARSLEEVKTYCKYYGFAGGIAEYGSILWDDIEQKAEILISQEGLNELKLVRDALDDVPGVFTNPFYQFSIRAYSYDRQRTTPIPSATIGELFYKLGIRHLTVKPTYIDTAIYDRSTDKGKALLKLKEQKGMKDGRVGAAGDTESDLPMLIVADRGYLVDNSTIDLKRKARSYGILITRSSFQSGLLEGVNNYLHGGNGETCPVCKTVFKRPANRADTFWKFLEIADRPKYKLWLHALDRNTLRVFQD